MKSPFRILISITIALTGVLVACADDAEETNNSDGSSSSADSGQDATIPPDTEIDASVDTSDPSPDVLPEVDTDDDPSDGSVDDDTDTVNPGEDVTADTDTDLPDVLERPSVLEITSESQDDYSHNRWGLIEADTLETYVENWTQADTASADQPALGRPAQLEQDSRLIILQLNPANRAAGENFVPSNPEENVYVYELDAFRFNETRDTGLISNSVRYQASGPTTDAWLAQYGIDLSRDFVVFAAGENTTTNGGFFQDLTRGVYWLSYWGAELQHLAIVNGTLNQNYEGTLISTRLAPGTYSNDGFSVRDLRVDHTGLTLPLEDFLSIVDTELREPDVIPGISQQFIIDARPTPQFNRTAPSASFFDTLPGQFITTAWNSAGPPSADAAGQAKSYVLLEGHIRGAVSFPWASLLTPGEDNNWQYRPKSELAQIFTAAGYEPADALTTAVVSQCRTNFEVQVNGFASRAILGYPTVYFDGSLVEYFSLVSSHPTAEFNLAESDPAYQFRTDTPARSQFYEASSNPLAPSTVESDSGVAAYNVPNGTGPADRKVAQAVINRSATTTRLALDADIAYKTEGR